MNLAHAELKLREFNLIHLTMTVNALNFTSLMVISQPQKIIACITLKTAGSVFAQYT